MIMMTEIEEMQEINQRLNKIEIMVTIGAKNVLTLDETALFTGLSKGYIYRLTSNQEIPHYKRNGRNIYFKKEEIEDWLLQNRVATKAEIESKATTYLATKKVMR